MSTQNQYQILLVAFCCGPNTGSEATSAWNWATQLAAAGHRVTVLTTPISEARCRDEVERLANIRLRTAGIPKLPGQRVYDAQGRLRYLLWLNTAYRVAAKLHHEERFDIVHHVTFGSLPMGSPFHRLPCRSVFGPVGGAQHAPRAFRAYFAASWRSEALRTALLRLLAVNPLTRRCIRKTDCILCSNVETMRLAERYHAKRAVLFFDFAMTELELDQAQPKPWRTSPPYVGLWVGRLVAHKALPLALDALACLPTDLPVTFKVYGHGPQQSELPGMIRSRALESRVEYCGSVSRVEMLKTYQSADFLLFTSLRESGGAQLSEAMAQGLPVVLLDHPGASGAQSILTDEAGIKVPLASVQQTPRDIADAIRRLVETPGLGERLALGARKRALELSWTERMRRIQDIYDTLVSSN